MDKASQPLRAGWARLPLWLRRIALGALVAWLLYVVAVNLVINTPLGRSLASPQPEKFQMDWSRAVTWWPGRVRIWDLHVQGHVRRNQWEARADRADGKIALLALFGRELHVPWIEAVNVSGGSQRVEHDRLPPPSRPGGWTLRFDRIATGSATRGHFDDLVLEGHGRGVSGFVKTLRGGAMELLPSEVGFTDARLVRGDLELLRDAKLDTTFAMAAHTREQAQGLEKLNYTDATLSLEGASPAFLIRPVEGRLGAAIDDAPGAGTVQADLIWTRGLLAPGSRLHGQVPLGIVDTLRERRDTSLEVSLDVGEEATRLRALIPELPEDSLVAINADFSVAGGGLSLQDWRERLMKASGHAQGRWHFRSLRWVGDLFVQAPWFQLDGDGVVEADLRVEAGELAVGSRLRVPRVRAEAEVMGNRIRGAASAEGVIEAGDDGQAGTRLQMAMEEFDIAHVDAPGQSFVRGNDLRLELTADAELENMRESLAGHIRFRDAHVPDLRAYNRYLPAQMRFNGGEGRLTGDVRIDADGDIAHGTLTANARRARMALSDVDLSGDVDIDVHMRRADLQRRRFDFGGTRANLRNVSFTEANGQTRDGWWARINVNPGEFSANPPHFAAGSADIAMRDVGFVLSLFSRQRDYPNWVMRLIDRGEARMQGRVRWEGDELVLDRMHAQNDRFEVRARMKLDGDEARDGDLLVRWGVLNLGVEMRDGRRKFRFARPVQWYESQPDLLR